MTTNPERIRNRRSLLGIAMGGSILVMLGWERQGENSRRVFCGTIYPPETRIGPQGPSECLLRTEKPGSDVLFIKGLAEEEVLAREFRKKPMEALQAFQGIVYRYDPVRRKIDKVRPQDWARCTGPIGGTSVEFQKASLESRVSIQYDQLLYEGTSVETAGRTALAFTVSPDRTLVAVLSAEGNRAESLMPFLGRGGASGQHYHELFRLPGMQAVGKPLSLPVTTERVTMRPIWSGDRGYVVYIDARNSHLCIVGIDLHMGTGP